MNVAAVSNTLFRSPVPRANILVFGREMNANGVRTQTAMKRRGLVRPLLKLSVGVGNVASAERSVSDIVYWKFRNS